MTNNKSDFKRFCETMWIMTKYDVLPWVLGAGIVAAVTICLQDAKAKGKIPQQQTISTMLQNQR